MILGPDAELQLRPALQIANWDPSTLVSTPLAIVAYVIILALLRVPAVRALATRRTQDGSRAG